MTHSGHLELFSVEAESVRQPTSEMHSDTRNLSSSAAKLARSLTWLPDKITDRPFGDRCERLPGVISPLLAAGARRPSENSSQDERALHEIHLLLESELADACVSSNQLQPHPQVRTPGGAVMARIAVVAEGYFPPAAYRFRVAGVIAYLPALLEYNVLY